jgi:iron complex transport system permease protein
MRQFKRWYWIALVGMLLVVTLIAVARGAVSVSLGAVIDALRGEGDPTAIAIVRDLRLPRIALAALVGAGLGASGAALQGTLRNPLAEPYLLGVSGGAAVGAVIAFAFGVTTDALITLAAFAGAVAAVFVALGVARVGGRTSRADLRTLLIAGVIVGAFANAAIMVALANASPNNIRGALWWMMGSAVDANWQRVTWLAVSVLVAGGALLYWAREIDVLSLGEDTAASLGVDAERAGKRVFILAALLAAATVAGAGLIGFVGLVVPTRKRWASARTDS